VFSIAAATRSMVVNRREASATIRWTAAFSLRVVAE
jgi:hypothetical protein